MFFPQRMVRRPKPACWKQILAVAIVFKGARLANQRINNVTVVNAVFAAAPQSGDSFDFAIAVPDLNSVGQHLASIISPIKRLCTEYVFR